jgi:hypothetical protein
MLATTPQDQHLVLVTDRSLTKATGDREQDADHALRWLALAAGKSRLAGIGLEPGDVLPLAVPRTGCVLARMTARRMRHD